ncbi:hypothetical protein L3Y34_003445 [Caenorhabditis briggsae]|uniref:Uncharacterized protein n=1 Tax=Caenorhabditis briggsae TaxID=6238 RepID=A0AAE9A967_CAEBR|nr:hypothetical protein L3Y34_003445 [Caenorhabditis briggsae]
MVVTIIKHKPRNKRKALSALKDENGGKKSKLSEYSSKQAVDDIIESVDDMSNPLYELLSNDFKSKEEFTVNDIAMMFKSLAETILKLQSQNTLLKNQNCILNANLSNLTEKVDGLEENLKLLSSQPKESPKPPTTLIKTFASAVASTISAPESQITFMRAASLANSEDARKSNVIIKNIDLSEEAIEKAEFASKIAKDCGTSTPSVFRIPHPAKGPPFVRLAFKSKEEARTDQIQLNQGFNTGVLECVSPPRPLQTRTREISTILENGDPKEQRGRSNHLYGSQSGSRQSCLQRKSGAVAMGQKTLDPRKFLKIGYTNSCSIKNKVLQLDLWSSNSNIDILCLVETKIDSNYPDSLLSLDEKYAVIRKDRNRHGGGLGILSKKHINYTVVSLPPHLESVEILFVDIKIHGKTTRLIVSS